MCDIIHAVAGKCGNVEAEVIQKYGIIYEGEVRPKKCSDTMADLLRYYEGMTLSDFVSLVDLYKKTPLETTFHCPTLDLMLSME
jgi:hypothetical protein